MAALDAIAPEATESLAQIGKADLVVAVPSCLSGDLLAAAASGLDSAFSALLPNSTAVILHPLTAASNGSTPSSAIQLVPYPLTPVGRNQEQSLEQGLRALSHVGRTLGARACVMLGSDSTAGMADDLRALAEPILEHGYDLSVPVYARRRFSSLINSGIVYPLTRAIYGVRLNYPMAIDLALSPKLVDRELRSPVNGASPAWISIKAICDGLAVCQVHRGIVPAPQGPEPSDLSGVLSQLLGSLFAGIERNAGFWQKVRGSQTARTFGTPQNAEAESASVDVHSLVDAFQRGCRDLLDIWAVALSPATLVELRKIAKYPVERFRLEDAVWAHVLYDFILGHRQRVISREHLLRSLTPIYLGWVASYALEVQNLSPPAVEDRLEKMYGRFEALKPYLLSRWRWPDRFNP